MRMLITGPSGPVPAPDWPFDGLEDDVAPAVAELVSARRPFALATIVAAEGGPRPEGTQMVVVDDRWWGFLSGGCVEAEVALQGRAVLAEGRARRLVYGRGSPFFDIRLPCGGRIELLVEPVAVGDPGARALADAVRCRRPVRYLSDGRRRMAVSPESMIEEPWVVNRLHEPAQRLVVVGGDPFALAIAAAGRHQGWEVTLVRPGGPLTPPPLDVAYLSLPPDAALAALAPDPWTAVAVATHEAEADHAALLAGLRSGAGYVGALGSRRRLAEREARLRAAGLGRAELARLHAPIGRPLAGARAPRELAVAVVAEIIADRARRRA